MKTTNLILSSLFLLTLAPACWVPNIPGDSESGDGDGDPGGDGDGETSTGDGDGDGDEPLPDMPAGDGDGDGDGDGGWCCECGTEPLACTPSSLENCTAEGFEWCLLDGEGDRSDCATACEAMTGDGDGDGDPLHCCNLEGVWGPCDVPQSEWCANPIEGWPSQCTEACA